MNSTPTPARDDAVTAPLVATVLPDVNGLDRRFDYLVPSALRDSIGVGSRVRVTLAGRRVAGWVVRLGRDSEVTTERLSPLVAWSGHGPSTEVVELAEWAAVRWGSDRVRPILASATSRTAIRAIPDVRARPATGVPADAIRRLVTAGGGVVRTALHDDGFALLCGLAGRGPLLVVHPAHEPMLRLAARLRGEGFTTATWPGEWAVAAGGAQVVIGGRAAVWATMPRLATVVVFDEHDESLQNERTPTWHARDVAIERAARNGAACILASPCPTVSALAWSGRRWVRPAAGDERDAWPRVDVIDRSEEEPWRRSLVSSALIEVLRDPAVRVACVHNTPGRSRMLACRSCRSLAACERCTAAVAQDDAGDLVCHRCQTRRPPVCQACGSGALANVRPGVARLREELEAAAARSVIAVTGAGVSAHDADATPPDGSAYVGTEAVLHRVRDLGVIAFLDFDAELFAPHYQAAERAMALLVRAARVVGPQSAGGRLLVQTSAPGHEVIRAVLAADPGRLAAAEAGRRRDLALPPFGALARVSGAGAADFVRAAGLDAAADGDVILVRAPTWDELGRRLATTPRPKQSRLRVEVDPAR